MAMEDAIQRLARALESQGDASAVREIIRQRDEALSQAARNNCDAEFYRVGRDNHYKSLERERRRNASLRGVITRMKKKAA